MGQIDSIKGIKESLQNAVELPKCKKCGCMKGTLETMKQGLSKNKKDDILELLNEVEKSIDKMEPIKYTWLGCEHCWSADIANAFDEVFSEINSIYSIESNLVNNIDLDTLPAIGEYHVLSLNSNYPVAISTLGNKELADKISELKPKGLSIVGKTETENIGVEKIIKNVLAVPSIKYLVLCGKDSEGHNSGNTLLSLVENGIDNNMQVIASKGKKPVLSNTTKQEVDVFRDQIEVIDMIECEDLHEILEKVEELSEKATTSCNCEGYYSLYNKKPMSSMIEILIAEEKDPNKVKLDKAGYFVIVPKTDSGTILVEHYSYTNQLLRIIKGQDSRNIYWTIIENGWVTELSHSAYLGKELTKAEMSINLGFKYVQDKAWHSIEQFSYMWLNSTSGCNFKREKHNLWVMTGLLLI
mgnify:CR=1 FL=1